MSEQPGLATKNPSDCSDGLMKILLRSIHIILTSPDGKYENDDDDFD